MISLTACLVHSASRTGRSSSAPSRMAYPLSTASGSSPIRSRQLAGVGPSESRGVRHRDPAPRRAEVGEHVEPPVPADPDAGLRVDSLLDHSQLGRCGIGFGQVGDPQVVTRRGAPRRRDDQPPPVPADRDAVVVGLVPALAEHERIVVGRRADLVQVDPPVVLALPVRHGLRRQPAGVVEGLAARQPGHVRVAAAVDRPVDQRTRGDVDHPQQRLLVAAFGHLVGQQAPLLVRLPGVQRRQPGRVDGHRVDEHLLRVLARRGTQPGAEHAVLGAGVAPGVKAPLAPPGRRADIAGAQQLAHPCGQPLPARQFFPVGGEQVRLRREPPGPFGARVVLQPSVGVADAMSQDVLGQVEPAGFRITELVHAVLPLAHPRTLRSPATCTLMWWRMRVPGDTLGA